MTADINTELPPPPFSHRRRWASEQAISFLMQQAVENRDVVSLAAGLVDQASLPVSETRTVLEEELRDADHAREMLQYGTTAGLEKLRETLVEHLSRLEQRSAMEMDLTADRIVLTTGSQQFLSLVGEVLLDPGDICLVAAPTYFVFLGNLNGLGARAISVATDADGMRMDALEAQLERLESEGELERVKLIYLVSYYSNPSGLSLSEDRRSEVVEIARRWSKRHRIMILEDAAYREMRYDGPVFPSVWSHDVPNESVILTQTFSKSFSPGIRVGYGILPRDLVDPICDRKGNEDFGSSNFGQHIISGIFDRGLYYPHVEQVRASYRSKRDCMLDAADKYFGDIPGVSWVHPHGGLYVWMTLPDSVDTGFDGSLFDRATKHEKVMYVPGELFYAGSTAEKFTHQMRLSYGVQTPEGIDEGMRRLSQAVRAML